MIDLRAFIAATEAIVARANLGRPGAYARSALEKGPIDPYGCADAANVLYTIGRFPRDAREREGCVRELQDLQEAKSGLYRERTHHPIHTTAHCIAALELFDAGPRHELAELAPLRQPGAIEGFLDRLPWRTDPWRASHQGAGVYASLVLAEEAGKAFEDSYFAWLAAATDPETGLVRQGHLDRVTHSGASTQFPHLAGTFHYLFNFEYARRPWRHPAALVDTCLRLRAEGEFPLGNTVGFAEIDWVFCLARSLRQSGHRFEQSMAALDAFAEDYTGYLLSLHPGTHERLNDLHFLFGMLCALAELQRMLPGKLVTERPLKLVLDRRPFI
jgi:hypothetical protein